MLQGKKKLTMVLRDWASPGGVFILLILNSSPCFDPFDDCTALLGGERHALRGGATNPPRRRRPAAAAPRRGGRSGWRCTAPWPRPGCGRLGAGLGRFAAGSPQAFAYRPWGSTGWGCQQLQPKRHSLEPPPNGRGGGGPPAGKIHVWRFALPSKWVFVWSGFFFVLMVFQKNDKARHGRFIGAPKKFRCFVPITGNKKTFPPFEADCSPPTPEVPPEILQSDFGIAARVTANL